MTINNPLSLTNNMLTNNQTELIFDNQMKTTLLEISHDAMSSLNLREVLSRIAKQAKSFLGVQGAMVVLLEDEMLLELSEAEFNYSAELDWVLQYYMMGKGLGGKAFQSGEIAVTGNYWEDDSFEHVPRMDDVVKKLKAVALIIIPIIVQDKVIGLVSGDKDEQYHWTEVDFWRAEQFASLAALAIQNARLFSQLEKHNRQMLAVQNFNRRLRGPIELKTLADHALRLAIEAVKADGGFFYLTDAEMGDDLRLMAYAGFEKPDEEPAWFELKAGIVSQIANSRQSVVIKNRQELLQQPGSELFELDGGWQSALFVPLTVSDKLTGIIALLGIQPDHFSLEKQEFIETIAGQIAIAVQQVSQIELYKEREQLTALLALAHTAAHELNQPLTVLQLELDMITEMGQKPDAEVFQRMQHAVAEITLRVRDYQRITRYHGTEVIEGLTFLDREKALQNQNNFYNNYGTIVP